MNAGTRGRGHRNRSSWGGRTSWRTEPSPNHDGVEAAHDRHGNARRLAHHELGGRRDLVGDRDLGDHERAPERVGRVAQVDDRGDAAHTDRDVGETLAPRPAERVGHDRRATSTPDPGAQRVADVLGRAVGVDRQQRGPALVDVREVDARRSRTRSRDAVSLMIEIAAACARCAPTPTRRAGGARRGRAGRAAPTGPRPSTRSSG